MRALPSLLLAVLGACTAATPSYVGRPCSAAETCGAGTRCDLARKVCVAWVDGAARDGTLAELGRDAPAGDGDAAADRGGDRSPADRGVDRARADRGGDRGCQPQCAGKQCGPDGCGSTCGTCASPKTCDPSYQCTCTPSCGTKNCGPDGCGGTCGPCGAPNVCSSGTCVICPKSCADLGYYTGSLRSCTFDGSNGCTCPGTDGNSNNVCDSGESCWGWDLCSTGDHNPANCHTKKNITVPAGCSVPAPGYCIECS